MAVNQRIAWRKRVFVGAALLATSVALLGGLIGRQQFTVVLVRIILSALGFSLLAWFLFETAQRRLPELFEFTLDASEPATAAPLVTPEPGSTGEEIPEEDRSAFVPFEPDVGMTTQGQRQESPSLMRQIVEQYTPEQLSRAVRTALDNT